MLVLSPIFTRGAKVSLTLSLEHLPSPSHAISIGLNDNLEGTGTSSRYCYLSFGLALLDSMPPEGCIASERNRMWGIHTTGLGSAESVDGREVLEGHVAAIASCGILVTNCTGDSEADRGSNSASADPSSEIVLRQVTPCQPYWTLILRLSQC